jgi:hypothetical protein
MLLNQLAGSFVVVNLGSDGDADLRLPASARKAITLVEADAVGDLSYRPGYHRHCTIAQIISDHTGETKFSFNAFGGCNSAYNPKRGLVSLYEVGKYYSVKQQVKVSCDTLINCLASLDIASIDFLKTDLEGLDIPVIKSCEPFLREGKILAIQAETHFQQFYEDEPTFDDLVVYLKQFNFEFVGFNHVESWRYKTRNRFRQKKGRTVWADAVFFRCPFSLTQVEVAKQVITAKFLGYENYGEFLLEQHLTYLPQADRKSLRKILGYKRNYLSLRDRFKPLELFLRYLVGSSRHVAPLNTRTF